MQYPTSDTIFGGLSELISINLVILSKLSRNFGQKTYYSPKMYKKCIKCHFCNKYYDILLAKVTS